MQDTLCFTYRYMSSFFGSLLPILNIIDGSFSGCLPVLAWEGKGREGRGREGKDGEKTWGILHILTVPNMKHVLRMLLFWGEGGS